MLSPELTSNLLGRDSDLALMESAARRAFEERSSHLVTVVAGAGMGKTRLSQEFVRRVAGWPNPPRVAMAACHPYGLSLTYAPLEPFLQQLTGGAHSDEAIESTLGKVQELIDRDRLVQSWRRLLEAAAAQAPLVLIFDDLQRAGESLLETIEQIVANCSHPIFSLALAEEELLERRPHWGGGGRNVLSLGLEPLADEWIGEIAGRQAANVTGSVSGNPFYAAQLALALREGLSPQPGLDQTLRSRLDLLSPAELRALQLASVFGNSFPTTALHELDSNLDVATLIEQLRAKQFLANESAFAHSLIRDTAYRSLSRGQRGQFHSDVAGWLEGHSPEQSELIAHHWQEAARTQVRPEAATTHPFNRKAVHWLSEAARRAARTGAHSEAVTHLRTALELAEYTETSSLYEQLGDCLSGNASVAAYQKAYYLSDDPTQRLRNLSKVLILSMRFSASVSERLTREGMDELRTEAQDLVGQVKDPESRARYHIADAFYAFWLGHECTSKELQSSAASARDGLTLLGDDGDLSLRSAAFDALGALSMERGDARKSREYGRKRMELGEHLALPERIDAYATVMWATCVLGELKRGAELSRAAGPLLRPGSSLALNTRLHLASWQLYCHTLLGDWDEVVLIGERALALLQLTGPRSAGTALLGFLCALDVAREQQDHRRVERYRDVVAAITSSFEPNTLFGKFRCYIEPDLDGLLAFVEGYDQVPVARPHLIERCLSVLADLRHLPSSYCLHSILGLACSHEYRILEAQTRRALGLIGEPGELQQALAIFEECEARPLAERVRRELSVVE